MGESIWGRPKSPVNRCSYGPGQRRYYQKASRRQGDTGENMIGLLERRLDALVYRAKFAPTPFAARQPRPCEGQRQAHHHRLLHDPRT